MMKITINRVINRGRVCVYISICNLCIYETRIRFHVNLVSHRKRLLCITNIGRLTCDFSNRADCRSAITTIEHECVANYERQ